MARKRSPRAASPTPPASTRVVALTGASAFIGSGLMARLAADPQIEAIIALDVNRPTLPSEKARWVELDLTQPTAAGEIERVLEREGVDTFVHLAYLSNPTHNSTWAHELETLGTVHVLSACAARRVRKLVVWSHTCVYGARPDNPNFLTEDHPLRGNPRSRFVRDKVEAEREVARFAEKHRNVVVTVLRTCSIVGPTVRNYVTRYFSRRVVPTLMGFDPLMQFVHEDDVLDAFHLAIRGDHRGAFNIVGEGVLPLSALLKLAGRIALPIPHFVAYPLVHALWTAQAVEAPALFLDYLRFLWVADGQRAAEVLGFKPRYTTRDAFLSFAQAHPPRRDGAAAGVSP